MTDNHNILVARVMARAQSSPDQPAIITGDQVISFAGLERRILAMADQLLAAGAEPGDRIVLAADSRNAGFVAGYLACHLTRCIAVPVDHDISTKRLEQIVQIAKPRAVAGSGLAGQNITALDYENHPAGRFNRSAFPLPSPEDDADLLFTTGTTGQPKGVLLTQRNITTAASHINAFIGNTEGDREVVPLPLSHSFGLGRLRCNLLAGGTIILVRGFAFPGAIFRALRKWQATGLASVPAGFAVLLRSSDNSLAEFADQLRYVEIGSAPMPLPQKLKLISTLPATRICMHYGLTEASRSSFIEFHESIDRLDSIGRPPAGVELRVLDDKGRPAATGEAGKIVVRGGHVMKAYYADAAATRAVFDDGWMFTGDYGFVDDGGYFYLAARELDLINIGGRKVAPVEVEKVLELHPAVQACACVGIADPQGITGQQITAVLVAHTGVASLPDDRELRTHASRQLETYKVPVAFRWIDSLPVNQHGKLQRLALRDLLD